MTSDYIDRTLDEAGIERTDAGTVEIIGRLFRLMTFVEKRLAHAYGGVALNHGEVDVLHALVRTGGEKQSPTRVAASLLCSSGTMTNRLDRLEKAGYLRREHGTEDRRAILLSITPEGRAAIARADAAREAAADEFFPGITIAERKTFVRLMRKTLVEWERGATP